jgi:RES domain-containing protein
MSKDPHSVALVEGQVWLRVADSSWDEPLDPTYADRVGGRWNGPGDGPTLYLCDTLEVAQAQIRRLLEPTPIDVADLADTAPFVLVRAKLPTRQRVADASSDTGLRSLGLPASYPRRPNNEKVTWRECRRAARTVRAAGLRGVLARSAVADVTEGRELAWFPAARARAVAVGESLPFASWRRGTSQHVGP